MPWDCSKLIDDILPIVCAPVIFAGAEEFILKIENLVDVHQANDKKMAILKALVQYVQQ